MNWEQQMPKHTTFTKKKKKRVLKSDVPIQVSKLQNKVQNQQGISKALISAANHALVISFPCSSTWFKSANGVESERLCILLSFPIPHFYIGREIITDSMPYLTAY